MNSLLQPFVLFPILIGMSTLLAGSTIPDELIREGSRLMHENQRLERAYLIKPVEINGFPCEGWTWFDSSGVLTQTELATDWTLGEIVIPGGSTIFLKQGRFIDRAWLAHDMIINGLPVDGGGKSDCAFHPDGGLRICFLTETTKIQGITVKGGVFCQVHFDHDGRLALCTLAQPYPSNGEIFPAGTEVWLNPNGSVKQSYRPGWLERVGKKLLDVVF